MTVFYQFQQVRIVGGDFELGRECVLMRRCSMSWRESLARGWATNLPHPRPSFAGSMLCVLESHIEPLTYLPDAEDLATQENAPDFEIKRPTPVYMPVRTLYEQTVKLAGWNLKRAAILAGRL